MAFIHILVVDTLRVRSWTIIVARPVDVSWLCSFCVALRTFRGIVDSNLGHYFWMLLCNRYVVRSQRLKVLVEQSVTDFMKKVSSASDLKKTKLVLRFFKKERGCGYYRFYCTHLCCFEFLLVAP